MVGSGSEESASVRRKRELTETVTATAMKQLFPQAAETMTPELAEKMKIEVFGKSKFFNCESVDDCSRGAIFRGTRRGSNENEGYTAVLEDLSDLLARSPSLGAWRFFAMEDPVLPGEEELERRSEESIERVTMSAQFGQVSDDDIDNMFRFPVVIIAIAAETRPFGADVGWTAWPKADKLVRMAVAFALGSLTFFTGATYAADAGLLNPALVSHIEVADKIAADLVLPTFDALLTIFIFHEAAHQVSARYNNMSWSFPVALPSLQIGSALSVNVLNDYAPNRKALFDTAVVGPVVGLALSLLLLAYGASLSDLTDATPLRVPVPVLRSSFLAYSTVLLAAPAEIRTVLDDAATQLVPLHPLAVAGFAGVLTNAVALLPLGRTDGGRALLCTVGRPVADGAVWAAAVATGVVGFFQPNDLLMTHILLVLGCQRGLEAPCVDEIAPVGRLRKNVHALLLLIAFSALVGAPFNSDGFIDTGLQSGFPGLTA